MSFLTDENLTFHRFSDGTISFDSMRKKSSTMGMPPPLEVTSYVDDIVPSSEKKPRLILREYSDASNYASLARNNQTNNDPKATTPLNGPVWTTQTSESLNSCYTNTAALTLTDESLSNDFTYMSGMGNATVNSTTGMLGNGSSTMKLVNTTSMEMYGNGSAGEQDKDTKQVRFNKPLIYEGAKVKLFNFNEPSHDSRAIISWLPQLCSSFMHKIKYNVVWFVNFIEIGLVWISSKSKLEWHDNRSSKNGRKGTKFCLIDIWIWIHAKKCIATDWYVHEIESTHKNLSKSVRVNHELVVWVWRMIVLGYWQVECEWLFSTFDALTKRKTKVFVSLLVLVTFLTRLNSP